MSVFANTGAFYDALAARAGRLDRERRLLDRVLTRAPGRRVLELACGTGIHAAHFAEAGCTVTAIDASETVIAFARRHRPHANITYITADMRAPGPGPWDAGFCLGNSLSLLPEAADLHAVFEAVARGLAKGGQFLVHVLNYVAPAARVPRHRVERVAVRESEVVAVKSLVPHGDRTLLSLNFFVLGGEAVQSFTDTAILRHWDHAALAGAAETAQFREAWSAGSFDGAEYNPIASPDLIMCFERP